MQTKVGRPKKDIRSVQLRFSVPSEDTQVLDWMKRQYNSSASIRALVKAAIANYGYKDCTCIPEITEANASRVKSDLSEMTSGYAEVMPAQSVAVPVTQNAELNMPASQPVAYAAPPQAVQPVPQAAYQPQPVQSVQPQYPQGQQADGADMLASMMS